MQQEFTEVIDGVRDQCCNAEVVSTGLSIGAGKSGEVDARQVEEGIFVVGAEVEVGLVIAGIYAVEGSVNFGFD